MPQRQGSAPKVKISITIDTAQHTNPGTTRKRKNQRFGRQKRARVKAAQDRDLLTGSKGVLTRDTMIQIRTLY